VKLFYPKQFYNQSSRWHIFPLLKTLLKEAGQAHSGFNLTVDESAADLIVLPMSWNYYYNNHQIKPVQHYLKKALQDKPILTFVFGDYGCKVPQQFTGWVYRTSGRRSKLPSIHKGMPIFIKDPVKSYYPSEGIAYREFSTTPVVGFCGQANAFGIQTLKELAKTFIKNVLSVFRIRNKDTEQIISTTYLRWKILSKLRRYNKITSNFIIRNVYRAGVKLQKETHPTTMEFYNNIKNSDYTVCIRGAGNFSTRFYETLAMGRIPVFVNTDCLLPLDETVKWKEHVVWVEYSERHLIAEKILSFHNKHNEITLNALFLENRKLWEDYLRIYSFFKTSIDEV